jgi:hypothetical protein
LKISAESRQFIITNMKGEEAGRVMSEQGVLSIKLGTALVYLAPVN